MAARSKKHRTARTKRFTRGGLGRSRRKLSFEPMEARFVLSGQGFLQGTAFYDLNNSSLYDLGDAPKPDALIELRDGLGNLLATTTTDAQGHYLFANLSPGTYQIVEPSTEDYYSHDTQIFSQIYPAFEVNNNTIQVTLFDPNLVQIDLFNGPAGVVFKNLRFDLFGNTFQESAGETEITVTSSEGVSTFESFCVNLFEVLNLGANSFPAIPKPDVNSSGPGSPHNFERIAYLFNHYGTTEYGQIQPLTPINAAALQLAIWELLYDSGDPLNAFTTGNLTNVQRLAGTNAADFASIINQATFYLTDSIGKSERAIYLDASLGGTVPDEQTGHQSFIATGSYNFANKPPARISGHKYEDLAGDGVTPTDPPLAGITINLYLDSGTIGVLDGDLLVAVDVTDVDGEYSFAGLLPGNYLIQEVVPFGYVSTTPELLAVTLASGDDISTGFDFYNFQRTSVHGYKFNDLDGDGTDDGGTDPRLAGWTIQLVGVDGQGNAVNLSTATDSNGEYAFANLAPGSYTVSEVNQTGWTQTAGGVQVTLTSGQEAVAYWTEAGELLPGQEEVLNSGLAFGNFLRASVHGYKFNDLDGDGTDDGGTDPRLANWSITLTGTDHTGAAVNLNTTTNAAGEYAFTNLTPGVYTVTEVNQNGWSPTTGGATFTLTSGQERVAYLTEAGDLLPGQMEVVTEGLAFGNRQLVPGIKLRKLTNGVDAETESQAPLIAPGAPVTWTYEVTNTGQTDFTFAQVSITDDAGTPGISGDDYTTANGKITFHSVLAGDGDNILEPGEIWVYQASDFAKDLGGSGAAVTFNLGGSSALDGPNGNIRTYSAGGISVKASAFSRSFDGVWSTAFLGAFSGGLGVTDDADGTGSGNSHTVDNINSDNYVLFEFSEAVVVDRAYLGYVVSDSDIRVWIGTLADPFNNHVTLSDALLSGMFTEVNETTLTTARWADFNNGGVAGNVLIIAANTNEPTKEDQFKIQKVTVSAHDCYANRAVVSTGAGGPTDSDVSFYCNPGGVPGIDIEKFTNGVNADNPADAPEIAPGELVTWTYRVTNTGTTAFAASEIVVTDDNGTPSNLGDDFNPVFDAVLSAGLHDGDALLEPGEVWIYKATATAQDLMQPGAGGTFVMSGSTSTSGTAGNIRTFSAAGVSVKASAFSRDTSGVWSTAYLGSYSGGLGVTDGSEGTGSGNAHTVDNNGRNNYVLFEFSESIIVDSAFLGYVSGDSDISVWIGSMANPFNNHLTLSDSLLNSLGFTEVNTGGSSARTADINAGQIAGNVLVIAARIGETNDYFKIEKLNFQKLELGIHRNWGRVVAGSVGDEDVSHYRNPECVNVTFAFAGNTATTGTNGNLRTYTENGVSVNVSAFSRTTSGTWNTAYLGAYSEGLGVTDSSESGGNGTHRVDNIGRYNFVLFEFSTLVEVDRVFLDSVVGDSDITIWIGTFDNPFHKHLTLSDALAASASLSETNETNSSSSRWANLNANGVVGNVLVIAASVSESSPNDQFKISKLDVCAKSVKFYTVDSGSDNTFEYGPSGQALANYKLNSGNTNPRGITTTAANNKVWVVDGNKNVYVYDTNGVLLGSWTANGLTTPEDIATNGSDIWIVDDGSNKVFRYAGGSGSGANRLSGSQNAVSSFSLNSGNQNAKGIVTDGTYLWVVNDVASGADKVFKYTLSGTLVGSWTIDSNNGSPTGITIDPANVNHIWISDSADDAVYRYNNGTANTSGVKTADHVFQLAGGNGDVQGIADPPPAVGAATALPWNKNEPAQRSFSMLLAERLPTGRSGDRNSVRMDDRLGAASDNWSETSLRLGGSHFKTAADSTNTEIRDLAFEDNFGHGHRPDIDWLSDEAFEGNLHDSAFEFIDGRMR